MWQGLANCYTKLSRNTDAIKAYKRAVIGGSTDISILVTLASLLEQEGDIRSAASFQHQIISETTVPGTGELTPMAAKAHLWLARMEIRNGDLDAAERHVNEALKGHYVLSLRNFVLIVGIGRSTSIAERDKGIRRRRSINVNSQCMTRGIILYHQRDVDISANCKLLCYRTDLHHMQIVHSYNTSYKQFRITNVGVGMWRLTHCVHIIHLRDVL